MPEIWIRFPIAYLSIRDEPEFCKQLVLSFLGKFISFDVDARLNCFEAETVRYAVSITGWPENMK